MVLRSPDVAVAHNPRGFHIRNPFAATPEKPSMTHGPDFAKAFGTLFVTMLNKISEIGRKPEAERTQQEKSVLQIQQIWDQLKTEGVRPTPGTLPPTPPALGS